MDKIRIKISLKGYEVKPDNFEMGKITNNFKKETTSKELTYKAISQLIGKGHSFILADYKKGCTDIFEENIESIESIALDVDSKTNVITMPQMISLIFDKLGIYPIISYRTFSDGNYTKFRLIYRLENKIDTQTYRTLYKALCWKFGKYLDSATCNPNRVWAGTNKTVSYTENDSPITFKILVKLINNYESKLKRDKAKREKEYQERVKTTVSNTTCNIKGVIKKEYRNEIVDILNRAIPIESFIKKHFGGEFRRKNNTLVGRCVLPCHSGDGTNDGAFVIFLDTNTYSCFTHCGSGNILTLAKIVYNVEYFSELVFKLVDEYNLTLDEKYYN